MLKTKSNLIESKRIFVGFNAAGAAGIYAFTRVLKKRGYKIDFYGFNDANFNFPVDVSLSFSQNNFISFFQRFSYFLKILPKYDIWQLNYGKTLIFYPLNLLILKLFGKKIICTFRGSEVRTDLDFISKDMEKVNQYPDYYKELLNQSRFTKWTKKVRTAIFCFFSDKVVINGPFSASSVKGYDLIIPYARKIDLNLVKPAGSTTNKLKIFHAPSNAKIKGSVYIEKAFANLAQKYPQHEFIILKNLDYKDLLIQMSEADIMIDQLLVGWYGGQAVEAMMMGKPVMSFIYEPYLKLVPFGKELPIIETSYLTFEQDLEDLINNPEKIKQVGLKGMEFADKYHSAEIIADQYLQACKEVIK